MGLAGYCIHCLSRKTHALGHGLIHMGSRIDGSWEQPRTQSTHHVSPSLSCPSPPFIPSNPHGSSSTKRKKSPPHPSLPCGVYAATGESVAHGAGLIGPVRPLFCSLSFLLPRTFSSPFACTTNWISRSGSANDDAHHSNTLVNHTLFFSRVSGLCFPHTHRHNAHTHTGTRM